MAEQALARHHAIAIAQFDALGHAIERTIVPQHQPMPLRHHRAHAGALERAELAFDPQHVGDGEGGVVSHFRHVLLCPEIA